jgi:hypothetical protein
MFFEPDAAEGQRVVITDDYGQRIQMSMDQLGTILKRAKSGALDEALLAVR